MRAIVVVAVEGKDYNISHCELSLILNDLFLNLEGFLVMSSSWQVCTFVKVGIICL